MIHRFRHEVFRFMLLRRIGSSLALLVALSVFFIFLLSMLSLNAQDVQAASQQERMERLLSEVENDLSQIDYNQWEILSSRTLSKFVYMYDDLDWYTRYSLHLTLQKELQRIRDRNDYVCGAWLYLPLFDRALSDTQATAPIEPWLMECVEAGNGILRPENGMLYKTVIKRDFNNQTLIAILIVQLNETKIEQHFSYISVEDKDQVLLEWNGESAGQEGDGLLAEGETFPIRVRCFPGESSHNAFITRVWLSFIAFIAIVILVELAGVILWYIQVYTPIHKLLIDAFDQTEKGNLKYRISIRKSSPFSEIYGRYNHMMERMEAYVENDLKQQILVGRANLKQLQSQIDPHFMYNSYYILHRLIKRGDLKSSEKFSEYLGQFYRYIARGARDEMSLTEEAAHMRTYAEIQKFRFRDALFFQFDDPPPEIAQILVPRLILQPLVENAFKYVYDAGTETCMRLRVSYEVRDPRNFDILIENSGDILPETLEAIREKLACKDEHVETTALMNIHRRLKIYFGESSGLQVSRSSLGGLRVRMCIRDTRKEARDA